MKASLENYLSHIEKKDTGVCTQELFEPNFSSENSTVEPLAFLQSVMESDYIDSRVLEFFDENKSNIEKFNSDISTPLVESIKKANELGNIESISFDYDSDAATFTLFKKIGESDKESDAIISDWDPETGVSVEAPSLGLDAAFDDYVSSIDGLSEHLDEGSRRRIIEDYKAALYNEGLSKAIPKDCMLPINLGILVATY